MTFPLRILLPAGAAALVGWYVYAAVLAHLVPLQAVVKALTQGGL